jgi:hypothetical protein
VLGELHIGMREALAVNLRSFGRKVFAMLRRTRKSRPVWREKRLATLSLWAEQHQLPPEPFVRMQAAVLAAFHELEAKGELD